MASLPGEQQSGLPEPDAARLVAVLAGHGIAAAVEVHGRLAVLALPEATPLPGPDVRAVIVAAGREAGFSSVAVELRPGSGPRS